MIAADNAARLYDLNERTGEKELNDGESIPETCRV
jgi:hypothetical protein